MALPATFDVSGTGAAVYMVPIEAVPDRPRLRPSPEVVCRYAFAFCFAGLFGVAALRA